MGILVRETNAVCNELGVVSQYRFRISAYNATGVSEPGEASDLFSTVAGKPDPPEVPSVIAKTDTSVSLSWEPPQDNGGPVQVRARNMLRSVETQDTDSSAVTVGRQSYQILANGNLAGTAETSEFTAVGLLPVHEYAFAVVAINEAGKSAVGAATELVTSYILAISLRCELCSTMA